MAKTERDALGDGWLIAAEEKIGQTHYGRFFRLPRRFLLCHVPLLSVYPPSFILLVYLSHLKLNTFLYKRHKGRIIALASHQHPRGECEGQTQWEVRSYIWPSIGISKWQLSKSDTW